MGHKYDSLVNLYTGFNDNIAELQNVINQLTSEIKKKDKRIEKLEESVNMLEQKELDCNIEIVGLIERSSKIENIKERVIKFTNDLGCESVNECDIASIYISTPKVKTKPSKVIVKLSNKEKKVEILKKKK